MKLPLHQRDGTIYDATGSALAACENESIAALIVDKVNSWQEQYALGYNAATTITNANRDREVERIRQKAERRGYDRGYDQAYDELLGLNNLASQCALTS